MRRQRYARARHRLAQPFHAIDGHYRPAASRSVTVQAIGQEAVSDTHPFAYN